MIVGTRSDTNSLQDIVRDMKSFTSRKIRKTIENTNQIHESRREWILKRMYQAGKYNNNNIDFQFWQQHYHPIELNTNELIDEKLEYIHLNPVAAGFVDVPEAWLHSSARDYSGIAKGAIELVYLS